MRAFALHVLNKIIAFFEFSINAQATFIVQRMCCGVKLLGNVSIVTIYPAG